jgi:hypothetical protein
MGEFKNRQDQWMADTSEYYYQKRKSFEKMLDDELAYIDRHYDNGSEARSAIRDSKVNDAFRRFRKRLLKLPAPWCYE